ncbi:MAG: MoaD/ThiS family protein [Planctomycetaceae bacterium]|nr:MoaD/ThiS family protein [Planctomycetaceae bacterium]
MSSEFNVLLFAGARQIAGTPTVRLSAESPVTVEILQKQLLQTVPALQSISHSLLWAVNGQHASASTEIPDRAEVACFPPVSGG